MITDKDISRGTLLRMLHKELEERGEWEEGKKYILLEFFSSPKIMEYYLASSGITMPKGKICPKQWMNSIKENPFYLADDPMIIWQVLEMERTDKLTFAVMCSNICRWIEEEEGVWHHLCAMYEDMRRA